MREMGEGQAKCSAATSGACSFACSPCLLSEGVQIQTTDLSSSGKGGGWGWLHMPRHAVAS